jgi:hypothetical protein
MNNMEYNFREDILKEDNEVIIKRYVVDTLRRDILYKHDKNINKTIVFDNEYNIILKNCTIEVIYNSISFLNESCTKSIIGIIDDIGIDSIEVLFYNNIEQRSQRDTIHYKDIIAINVKGFSKCKEE